MKKYFSFLTLIAIAWFAVVIWHTVHAAAGFSKIFKSFYAIEVNGIHSASNSREAAVMARDITESTAELDFFNSLLDIYPENRGYLRTQKVISEEVKKLRGEAGRKLGNRLHIAVDTKANKLYFKQGLQLLWEADCSVGKGGILKDKATGQVWEFATPRGEFRVKWKMENPIWIKPDWAFVESKQPLPPRDDPSRRVEGELGKYVLDIGDGYLIHGTKDEKNIGTPVSHGCVRLGAENLEKLYTAAPIGTKVYIY